VVKDFVVSTFGVNSNAPTGNDLVKDVPVEWCSSAAVDRWKRASRDNLQFKPSSTGLIGAISRLKTAAHA